MSLHFVLLKLGDKKYKDKVSTEGCGHVADFKTAIKNAYPRLLSNYDVAQLSLFPPDKAKSSEEIDAGHTIEKLKEFNPDPWNPLIVTVDEPPAKGSSKKQVVYKGLTVESTCRKFFDALAKNLANYYRFKWAHESYPTFGDVLFAYQRNDWSDQYRYLTKEERTDEEGFTKSAAEVPILDVPLSELFSEAEWVKLKDWNQKTNSRIHNANLPRTSTGKYFVIIPTADFNAETVSFFKTIGVKGHLYSDKNELEVKDESDLSGS